MRLISPKYLKVAFLLISEGKLKTLYSNAVITKNINKPNSVKMILSEIENVDEQANKQ